MPGSPAPGRGFYMASGRLVERPTRKLHPLHTPDWLHSMMLATGEYPEVERCTGRTTILALEAIVKAMQNPHTPVHVKDHVNLTHNHMEVVKLAHDFTKKLGLEHFQCSPSRLTVTFGEDRAR